MASEPRQPAALDPLGIAAERVMRQVRDHAMFLVDLSGRAASWNEGVGRILGWDEADWLGQPLHVTFTEEDIAAEVPEQELRSAESVGPVDDDRWMVRKDGERFFANGSVTSIRDDDGRTVGFLKVLRDGTAARRVDEERQQALAAERAAHDEAQHQTAVLRATIDAIPDALYIGDELGITACNPQALALVGASSVHDLHARIDELVAKFRLRHERGGSPVAPDEIPFSRALKGETTTLETWATTGGGNDVLIRGTAAPIRIDGRIVGAVAINSDLTGRVLLEEHRCELARVESRLRARDAEFRALIMGVRDYAIFTVDLNGCIASWHVGAQLMKGYSAEEAVGMPFANLFTPQERALGRPQHEMDVAATTGEYKGEGRRLRKNGETFDAAVVLTALRGTNGELLGYLKLTQDITQRKRAEAERAAMLRNAELARAEAERASHSKDEFLATISHELRTPLSAILGWSHLLERGLADAAAVKHGLAAITRNARMQVQLIEDLLDMSRIESGRLRLEMQRVDVGVVVASALEAVLLAATDKGVAVSASFESDECIVKADPARLQQIVWNLLSNAVKFTPEGGKVKVSVSRLADRLAIGVSDTGQGMEPDFIDRAFDRFQQQDATSTRRHGGLGLGLSIVRQLTQLLGGTVRAESPGPGLGSTFTVCLPTLGAESEESQHPTAGAAPVEGPAPEDARLTDFKVLLIDDAPDGRAVAGYALRAAGAEVLSAGSAVEGLQLFREHAPNAILCDIGMPEHDGYEFIRWVRELERSAGRHTPAAAFTAYARAGDRARALDSGYEAHLVKPIGPAALVDAVVSLVQNEPGDTQHAGGQPAQSDG